MSFVRCEGLVKIYQVADLEVFALQGLDLSIAEGEMMAIIGNSGSGKSTLLNILGGLDTPSAGRCIVGGQDLLRLTAAERTHYQRSQVGFVWQNSARNLIPYLSALDNVLLPLQLTGRTGSAQRRRAMELLDEVGLAGRADHRLQALSGGEQQRVAIALALANQPALLLADEPTGSVESQTAAQILGLFRAVNQRWGTTVVIVTHDRSLAKAVDRYVLIQDGKVAQEALRRSDGALTAAVGEVQHAETHDELTVLDSAGRLQIPLELRREVGLGDRARVEVEGDHIVVRRP